MSKENLHKMIDALLENDSDTAEDALHAHIVAKVKTIVEGDDDSDDDEKKDEKKEDDDSDDDSDDDEKKDDKKD